MPSRWAAVNKLKKQRFFDLLKKDLQEGDEQSRTYYAKRFTISTETVRRWREEYDAANS